MPSLRARTLPRVREALQKAERARFYKQRTNKYLEELRMTRALAQLENARIAELARISHETMRLRMRALHLRDEEKRVLEADLKMLEDVMKKIEFNKRRNFEQEAKYKMGRSRKAFEEKRRRWDEEDAKEPEWREEIPTRQPQVKLDECLIYPTKRSKRLIQQEYHKDKQQMLSPNQVAHRLLQRLRDEAGESEERRRLAEAEFLAELEHELQPDDDEDSDELDDVDEKDDSPFVTQQLSSLHRNLLQQHEQQRRVLDRILHQIQNTRESIQHWQITQSQDTADRLGRCLIKRKLKRPARKPTDADTQASAAKGDEDGNSEDEDKASEEEEDSNGFDGGSSFRLSSQKPMAGQRKEQQSSSSLKTRQNKTRKAVSFSSQQPAALEPVSESEEEVERQSKVLDPAVRSLSQRLSEDFRPEDFNKRRESLMRELDEDFVSPEERQRRMREFQLAWEEVLRCKYIRGYDPPEMRLPEGQTSTEYVFGNAEETKQLEKIVQAATVKVGDSTADSEAVSDAPKKMGSKAAPKSRNKASKASAKG